jgi:hypothetical protein
MRFDKGGFTKMRLNINSRLDLTQYITECMGSEGSDEATQPVLQALLASPDMPSYGAGHDAWYEFLDPLDFWQIHEAMGSSFVPELCHPNNKDK